MDSVNPIIPQPDRILYLLFSCYKWQYGSMQSVTWLGTLLGNYDMKYSFFKTAKEIHSNFEHKYQSTIDGDDIDNCALLVQAERRTGFIASVGIAFTACAGSICAIAAHNPHVAETCMAITASGIAAASWNAIRHYITSARIADNHNWLVSSDAAVVARAAKTTAFYLMQERTQGPQSGPC